MNVSGKTLAIIGAAAIGAIALYLYLKRTPTTATAPSLHPLADVPPASIWLAHRGIHGDDPSSIKGDLLPIGSFSIASTENAPAVDVFFGRTTVGAPIAQRSTTPGVRLL